MDELTALRRLESDTAAPTEEVMHRAFTALDERMAAAEQGDARAHRVPTAARRPRDGRRRLVPIWTTAVVAAAVAAVAVVAIHSAPAQSGSDAGAPAAPSASAAPAAPATPSAAAPSAAPSAASSSSPAPVPDPTATAKPDYEFDLSDPRDVARADAELACYRSHGVKIVGLTKPDAHGIAYIEYGGVHNDQRSITLGLQYQAACTAVGDAAN